MTAPITGSMIPRNSTGLPIEGDLITHRTHALRQGSLWERIAESAASAPDVDNEPIDWLAIAIRDEQELDARSYE